MQFNSYLFAAFFAVVLLVYNWRWLSWRGQKLWLLVTSYVFYAAWDPVFILLVWLCTFIDWTASALIWRAPTPRRKRALLVVSVIINLGVLGYFKYGDFILENVVAALDAVGIAYRPAPMDIVLPIGISFYTFHTLSYTLDIYLGRTKPWPSFLDFALYVTFFPALVAGPILRASQFLPQCEEPRRTSAQGLAWGAALLVLGLFEKCVLADVIMAPAVDDVFATSGHVPSRDAWIGTLAFTGQIFCDFAGYSTCALGAAYCLGFALPDNFKHPYAAIGFSDFWRRWHISLSAWLRDYLYIPLGGNRAGPTRTHVNLMLTMLIGGLWHGASWTFVVWGGLHGAYLIGERVFERLFAGASWRSNPSARLLGAIITFVLVAVAWVFFRAASFSQAFAIVAAMFGAGQGESVLAPGNGVLVGGTLALILATSWFLRDRRLDDVVEAAPWPLRSVALATMMLALVVMQGPDRAFIYFQF